MGTEVTKSQAALPAFINKVAAAGQRSATAASNLPTGDAFGEYNQDNGWVYGQDKVQVEEGSHWAVNVELIRQGFISWHGAGARPDEATLAWIEGGFQEGNLPESPDPWFPAWGFTGVCLNGEDKDQQVVFKGNSMGMDRIMLNFTATIGATFMEIQSGDHPAEYCHPVVELKDGNSYTNRQGKHISNPDLVVVGWANSDGEVLGQAAKIEAPKKAKKAKAKAEPAPEPEAKEEPAAPARRRRRKAK